MLLTRVTSRESLFMPYVNNKGTDQSAHQCSLISIYVVCCSDSISLVVIYGIPRLLLASVADQSEIYLVMEF